MDGSIVFPHWHHLANTIELVFPWAHPCPQRKRQIDRFGRFCIAQGRKSLCFTAGRPFPQNCPIPWGSGPNLTHNSLVPSKPSRFCTDDGRVSPYFTMGRLFPPQNRPLPWGIWTPSNTWFPGLTDSSVQTASRSVQPFLQSSLLCLTLPLPTDRPHYSVGNNRSHLRTYCDAA